MKTKQEKKRKICIHVHIYMYKYCIKIFVYRPSSRQTARLMEMPKMQHLYMEMSPVTCLHETQQKKELHFESCSQIQCQFYF